MPECGERSAAVGRTVSGRGLLDNPVTVVADLVERVAYGTEVQHASFGFDEHVEFDGLGERDALALDWSRMRASTLFRWR